MSLAVLRSRALAGMEAPAVIVEVHLANGLPGMTATTDQIGLCKFDTGLGTRGGLRALRTVEQTLCHTPAAKRRRRQNGEVQAAVH